MMYDTDAVSCRDLAAAFSESGVSFVRGVSDSTLVGFEREISKLSGIDFSYCVDEAQAIAEVAGNAFVDSELGLVYLQNSGLGAVVNALTSLWSFPCVLLVNWRGYPGTVDSVQHVHMGEATEFLLSAIGVDSISLYGRHWRRQLLEAVSRAKLSSAPVALLMRPSFIRKLSYDIAGTGSDIFDIDVIHNVLGQVRSNDIVVTSVGNVSRIFGSVYKEGSCLWLPVAGCMGSAFSVALSIASGKPESRVFCVEGDGSVAMSLSARVSGGLRAPSNLRHIVIANGGYGTFGGEFGFNAESLRLSLIAGTSDGVLVAADADDLLTKFDYLANSDSFGCLLALTDGAGCAQCPPVDFAGRVDAFRKGLS